MIRIGVIGYGYWGPNLVRNCYEAKGAQVACVSDLRDDRLASVSSRYPTIRTTRDGHDLIGDPAIDAVAIATPVSTHYELALRALREGKHGLVEKPLASDTDQVPAPDRDRPKTQPRVDGRSHVRLDRRGAQDSRTGREWWAG